VSMFAVDWVLPAEQEIAVAGYYGDLIRYPFGLLRDNVYRRGNPRIDGCGWHFSWLGGPAEIERKCRYHCHSDLTDLILKGNPLGWWYEQGMTWFDENWSHRGVPPHNNLHRMIPSVVHEDDLWYPAYIRERRCPESWFRPKEKA
jgi:hypothetical protein